MTMQTNLIIMGASGRMGSTLVRLAMESQDFNIVAVVDPKINVQEPFSPVQSVNPHCLVANQLEDIFEAQEKTKAHDLCKNAVIIDFTAPSATMTNAKLAAKHTVAHVIGTTGISVEEKDILVELAKKTPLLLSPNMSVGVNVLLDILPKLTAMLGDAYDTDIMEIHHNRKKDAPSGTALRLAEAVAEGKQKDLAEVACYHREGIIGERPHDEIGLQTIRGGDVVGVHTIYYMGAGERIEVTHQAHSRDNFANGALRAALWLNTQKAGKLYSMKDVLADD